MKCFLSLLALASSAAAHYTFPELVINGRGTGQWTHVRKTANFQTNGAYNYCSGRATSSY
jgi:hypothetical protein